MPDGTALPGNVAVTSSSPSASTALGSSGPKRIASLPRPSTSPRADVLTLRAATEKFGSISSSTRDALAVVDSTRPTSPFASTTAMPRTTPSRSPTSMVIVHSKFEGETAMTRAGVVVSPRSSRKPSSARTSASSRSRSAYARRRSRSSATSSRRRWFSDRVAKRSATLTPRRRSGDTTRDSPRSNGASPADAASRPASATTSSSRKSIVMSTRAVRTRATNSPQTLRRFIASWRRS